jgi:hypothetical protein
VISVRLSRNRGDDGGGDGDDGRGDNDGGHDR